MSADRTRNGTEKNVSSFRTTTKKVSILTWFVIKVNDEREHAWLLSTQVGTRFALVSAVGPGTQL